MGLLRSEKMGYYNLIMQADMGWRILNQLGKLSVLQFVDLNADQTVFNRRYASYIRRCEEAERRIRFLMQEQERFKIQITPAKDIKLVLDQIDEELDSSNTPAQTYFETLEADLESYEKNLGIQLKNYEDFQTSCNGLIEKRLVLKHAKETFGEGGMGFSMFKRLAGIIDKEDMVRFKRMVFRVTRGNALTIFHDIEEPLKDPKTDEPLEKSVFFILYQGDEQSIISNKLARICDTIGIRRYDVPSDQEQLATDFRQNEDEINTNNEVAQRTKENIMGLLQKLASTKHSENPCSLIEEQRLFIIKEKAIYHNLNMFTIQNNIFYGNCWCPKSQEQSVIGILNEFARQPGFASGQLREVEGGFPEDQIPPTYFKLNDFTIPFQEIVDTYGVPVYQEANPALFTCVTFPFLFGIMFGDVGHGSLLTLFALYLIFQRRQIESSGSMFKAAVPIRYLLLMMGLCAIYCGLIYNDFLGIPFDFFGTRWSKKDGDEQYTKDSVYPFGMDPVWYRADNELVFFNSFKMKISVVFGVTQMICGNFFKGVNSIHFKNPINFIFEFIPQLLFMVCFFGYMILMVFIKWCTEWHYNWNDNAPNLITILMNMALKMGSLGDSKPLYGDDGAQESIQLILLLIAVICVPIMLIPKPFILKWQHEKAAQAGHGGAQQVGYQHFEDEEGSQAPKPGTGHKEFDFGEEFIHQMIETIEYVLGAVSNTASYLRLWALSLAHGQLSKVFFDKCLAGTIETSNPVLVVVGFFVFANVTVGVLMCMDAMECFLHALRLHWVEFQSKFYKGEGIKFAPFSFLKVINDTKK
ncbi:unnamed protein product [Blepharisma stoltei]|uniref:V-type proton ATPase subunit a n=1 Tax=Blepharisma stoltei TaxID=1481888 RepID=A0AAU9ILF7_9CILI|nr:unnamed protein product [Blepharisma stoltei]